MPQRLEDLLFALEEQFWLKSADYYQRNLADAALMVFPEPAGGAENPALPCINLTRQCGE